MTDNPESAGTVQEQPGSPNSGASQQVPDSPTSGGPDVDALIDAILDHPKFKSSTQSVKDKRIAEIQTTLEEQGGDLARLAKALGHTPEEIHEAQTKIAMEDMLQAFQSGTLEIPNRAPDKPAGQQVDLAKARQKILTNTGLAETTPGFDDYLSSLDWSDPIEAASKATQWAVERKAGTKPPSPADKPPAPSGNAVATDYDSMSNDDLADRLTELQANPTKNIEERKKLAKELKRRTS